MRVLSLSILRRSALFSCKALKLKSLKAESADG